MTQPSSVRLRFWHTCSAENPSDYHNLDFQVKGLIIGTPALAKSVVLRVATVSPWVRAVAAIMLSFMGMDSEIESTRGGGSGAIVRSEERRVGKECRSR